MVAWRTAWFRQRRAHGVSAVAATQSETADDGAEPPTSAWADTDWVEACYGCLSWTAKLYVFWTAFAVRYDAERETDTQTTVAAAGGVVVLASLMLLAYASPTLARRLPCGNAAPARPLVAIY